MEAHNYFNQDKISGLLMSIQGVDKVDPSHKYFYFSEPRSGMTSFASLTLTNLYLPNFKQSIKKWREDKRKFKVYNADLKRNSKEFNYLTISESIRRNGYFDFHEFDLLGKRSNQKQLFGYGQARFRAWPERASRQTSLDRRLENCGMIWG